MSTGNVTLAAAAKFQVSERQARRYIADVFARWRSEGETLLPFYREQLTEFLWETASQARADGQHRAAVAAVAELAKIRGLVDPAQNNFQISVAQNNNFHALTAQQKKKRLLEVDDRVQQLRAQRHKALAKRKTPTKPTKRRKASK